MSLLKGKWLSNFFEQEIPSGTCNGVNRLFTLSYLPCDNESVLLTLNGRPLKNPADYSISGVNITLVDPPAIGQELNVSYIKKN